MKKLLLFTILTFVLASGVQAAAEKKAEKPEDKLEIKCKDVNEAEARVEWHRKSHKAGYDKFKKHHKDLICQLKKIRDIAVKENATQTVKALDELITKKQKHLDKKKAKLSKGKGCPPDCVKSCCAAKKKSGTCPKLKDSKGCPVGCTMPCCAEKKKSGTSPKTKAKKTSPDN